MSIAGRQCSVKGCLRPYESEGLCQYHYTDQEKIGKSFFSRKYMGVERRCSVTNCNNEHLAVGFCRLHYTRNREKGNPLAYSVTNQNTYTELDAILKIDLRNRSGEIVGQAIINIEDKEKVLPYRWCIDNNGYALGRVNGRLMRLHKLIVPEIPKIDHEDRDKLNNRRDNLRQATSSQNMHNRSGIKKTSIHKGVSRVKDNKRKPWAVYAKFPKSDKRRFWGYYETEIEAAKAYNKYAKLYGDEFTYLNTFPDEDIL